MCCSLIIPGECAFPIRPYSVQWFYIILYKKTDCKKKIKKNNPKKEIDSNERLFGITKRKAEIARKNDFFIHSNNFTDRYRYGDMLPPLKSLILKWGLLAQWLY